MTGLRFCLLTLFLLLAGSFLGCGKGSRSARSSVSSQAAGQATAEGSGRPAGDGGSAYREGDEDEDKPLNRPDPDDSRVRDFGEPATLAEARYASTLIKRYYRAAVKGDAKTGCELLSPKLRSNPHLGVTEEEMYPPPLSLPPLSGASCQRILSVLFKEAHAHVAAAAASVRVILVRTDGSHGVALLGFKASPERLLNLERRGRGWRLAELLDSEVP